MSYSRLSQTLNQMKGCLASGFPFVFGFTVYESFESQTWRRPASCRCQRRRERARRPRGPGRGLRRQPPALHRAQLLGHGWGMQGYFTMPYAYLTDRGLASDFWTIRLIKG